MGTLEWLPLDREQRNLLFYGGIGLLLLLLGIFFCFEKNVFHKTRNAERLYLSLVMLIAYVWTLTTTISYESETVDGEGKSDFDLMAEKHPFLKLLPTTLEFTVVTLVATGALLNVVESKVRKFTGSWPLAERFIVPSYRAKRKVQEIRRIMHKIEKTTNFLAFQVQPWMFPVFAILYFFFKSAAESSLIVAYMVMGILVIFLFLVTFFFLKNFANNVVGGVNVSRRRRIEEIFVEATLAVETRDELNYIVVNVNLAEVLSEAPTSTIKFFSSPGTLSIMSTVTKAIVLDALQKRGASGVQKEIADIFFSCRGAKLTKLKNIIDTGSDYHNLLKLMDDVTEVSLRMDVLDHISREARRAVEENGGKKLGTKTLSDVDDTLYCSAGKFPVGVDKRLPRRCIYPGVFKFLEVLDKVGNLSGAEYVTVSVEPVQQEYSSRYSFGADGREGAGGDGELEIKPDLEHIATTTSLLKLRRGMDGSHVVKSKKTFLLSDPSSCNLVFLSARPHLYKELTEQKSYRRFRRYVKDGRLHKMPTLLPGRLLPGTKAFLLSPILKSESWRAVGDTKFATFCSYSALYPEYDFVFIGDNGQGDLYAAQKMIDFCADPVYNCDLRGVFIHQVQPRSEELRVPAKGSQGDASDFEVFRTYVGAAVASHEKSLINVCDLHKVALAAINDFDDMRALHPEHDFEVLTEQLSADVAAVNKVLENSGEGGFATLGIKSVSHLATMASSGLGRDSALMATVGGDEHNSLNSSLLSTVV